MVVIDADVTTQTRSVPAHGSRELIERCLAAGDLHTALPLLQDLLPHHPDDTSLLYQYGAVLYHLSRDADAADAFQRLCLLQPAVAAYHEAYGLVLFRLRQYAAAAASFARASVLNPANPENMLNLGACEFEQKHYEAALNGFAYVAQHAQNPAQALLNQAVCLGRLKRHAEAIDIYQRLKSMIPDDPRLWSGLGIAHHRCGQADAAQACFQAAIAKDPRHVPAWLNWGVAAMAHEDLDTAIQCFRQAVNLGGGAEAAWNLSLALLGHCDYAEGFALHESRLQHLSSQIFRAPPGSSAPYLESLEQAAGRRIYLYDEQGLGDAIQFSRYLQMLKSLGAHISVRLFKGLRPVIATMNSVDTWVDDDQTPPDHDFQCPLMSLAHVCRTTQETVPFRSAYLQVPKGHVAPFIARLHKQSNGRPLCGLMWSGNPMNPNDERRSIPLRLVLSILDEMQADSAEKVQWVALGNALSVDDAILLRQDGRILDVSREIRDFADTADLLKRCQYVVVVDTSVAHLAGALGVPTRLLLPRSPDWRWGLQGETSVWYDSVRLVRQERDGQWEVPLRRALNVD